MGIENTQDFPKKETGVQAEYEHIVTDITHNIEGTISEKGFVIADEPFASHVIQNNELFCRNESLSKVLETLHTEEPIHINNKYGDANMCVMSNGEGFRVAMEEGFPVEEMDKFVNVVISFKGEHLESRENIPPDSDLWKNKPKTARFSLSGKGFVNFEDIEMISVRYPTRYFPEEEYTDKELERIEEDKISFIVRHYIPTNRKTAH